MRAAVSTTCLDEAELVSRVKASESLVGANLVKTVSGNAALPARAKKQRWKVVAIDCGLKKSILDCLAQAGCDCKTVAWNTSAESIMAMEPDGVFVSNGPGDPSAVDETSETVASIMGTVPVFGICLGHQMMARAAGGRIEKLKFGHHGGNQPVKDLTTGRVEITVHHTDVADSPAHASCRAAASDGREPEIWSHPAHARELERQYARGYGISRYPSVFRAISPGGGSGASRFDVFVRALRSVDGGVLCPGVMTYRAY